MNGRWIVKIVTRVYGVVKQAVSDWSTHQSQAAGAALAFYTMFSIAPLFLLVLALAGWIFGEQAAQKQLFDQIAKLVGTDGGQAIQSIVAAAHRPRSGMIATIAAMATLAVGATAVFVQLQTALNTVWSVRRKPGAGLRHFIKARLLSFAMIVVIAFLLLVSLVINAALAAAGRFTSGFSGPEEFLWHGVEFIVSFAVVVILFAMIFKVLPDVFIPWRDVWVGSFLTALLFNVGKLLLGVYLGRSSVASAYGAAGSLVIILMWVYYSSQILLMGAEFTHVYSLHSGTSTPPAPGAQLVEQGRTRPARVSPLGNSGGSDPESRTGGAGASRTNNKENSR